MLSLPFMVVELVGISITRNADFYLAASAIDHVLWGFIFFGSSLLSRPLILIIADAMGGLPKTKVFMEFRKTEVFLSAWTNLTNIWGGMYIIVALILVVAQLYLPLEMFLLVRMACGIPIFSVGRGGIGHILGPTGGYLLGYLPAVYVIGLISERRPPRVLYDVTAMVCGSIIIYACGVPWLKHVAGLSLSKAIALGVNPIFLAADTVKIIAAIPVARALRPVIYRTGKQKSRKI